MLELTAEGGRKSYFVHKNLLAAQSVFLKTTVDTAVAADRKIDLQAWDGETVGHFVDFLYLQTYQAGNPEPLCPIGSSSESTVSDMTDTHSGINTPETIVGESRVQRDDSSGLADPRPLTPLSALRQSEDDERDRMSCDPTRAEAEPRYSVLYPPETHDYHDFLLAHARVYVLAHSLGIETLQSFAYQRLLAILSDFEPIAPGSNVAVNIVELLYYVYTKTDTEGDPMRRLVTQFAALNFPALQRTDELKERVRQGGELAADLLEKVCRRLVASEAKLTDEGERFAALDGELTSARERCAALDVELTRVRARCEALEGDLIRSQRRYNEYGEMVYDD